ncbi:S8 family serine peptidase [Streptomyces sp. UNOC14_S4]|uniref:S8 family serine peptidase n=1 Tax=Streptomyces sp. UNOC14_S4 TaxID=2872340 RepID=UPI001E3CCF53|nr:S8 family serine peptidase [Streptomyces sp. UNOC14_S4]MCC3766646.1 S8 family serine peptidase [Streptomyces sp. UNOC14_S4]
MSLTTPRVFLRALTAPVLIGAALLAPGGLVTATAQDIRSKQWYLDDMQADRMWGVSKGQGITVAVVDSGVKDELPELRGQVLEGVDVSNSPTGPHKDEDGHGTNMAALIAGTGAEGGVQGLAPGVKILPVKSVVNRQTDAADPLLGRAIRYAADRNAQIINVSMGAKSAEKEFPKTQEAVDYALKKGSLIFAASGNGGDKGNYPEFPGALPGVVAVSAIDNTRTMTKWSTHGRQVSLAAPGDEIPGYCLESDGLCAARGTSQASALASASAALIWSAHPDWTNNQVLRVMIETAGKPLEGPIPSPYLGYGIVRPRKVLLDHEGDPGPANINPLLAGHTATSKPMPATPKSKQSSDSKNTAADSASHDSGLGTVTWVALGAGAAVLVTAATAFAVVRRRKA